jgi:hypothetical protein
MRHLMTEHAEVLGAEGRGIVSRIDGAIDFADKLLATNPLFARANPLVGERIQKLKEQNRHYLAHEYFNRDWHPMHFGTMAKWLEPAKVQYACSANYLDHVDIVNLSDEQQAFLKDIPDPMFAQAVRDFMVNQQFRKDYWVKGIRKLAPLDQAEQLRAQRLILTVPRADVSLKVNGALGEASMSEEVYNPLLDYLSDYKPRSLAQIEQALKEQRLTFGQIIQAIMVLSGAGYLAPVQEDAVITKSRKYTEKMNAHLIDKARASSEVVYLTSPVTGGGIAVGRFPQLFLLAASQGKKHPEDWAQFVWQILSVQGQKLIMNGQTLETAEENLSEITDQAKTFALTRLPIMKALQIV